MNSHSDGEEIATRRMVEPAEDLTRSMDTRALAGAEVAQDEVVTRHISTAPASLVHSSKRTSPLGALDPGSVIGGDCVVIRTHHNHESGRPGLFECQAPEGHVMVKVAASEYPPQTDLWAKLSRLDHPKVLKIFRTFEADGRFYEVQEFCSGGTLADYVPFVGSGRPTPTAEWVERALVPAFHAGISYLHNQGIVHRDIKPSNLYLHEQNNRKTLVIGDFDISAVLQSGRTSRSTERVAGTWIYSAPEAFPRFVDQGAAKLGSSVVRSSDYYSFGVVIVELLLGTTPLHQAQLPDLYDFYLQSGRVEVPAGLSPRLTELLGGLLCRNRNRRWGDDEVERWLLGQTTEDDRRRISEDQGYELSRSAPAFTAFERSKPTSLAELGRAMLHEPEVAVEELMSSDVMLNWIGQIDSRVARLIRQDREKWRAQPMIALLCARLHIDPDSSIRVGGHAARSAAEWIRLAQAAAAQNPTAAESICNSQSLQELEIWLRLKSDSEVAASDHVAQIATIHGYGQPDQVPNPYAGRSPEERSNPRLVLEELGFAFNPQKPYPLAANVSAQTPGEIARLSLGDEEDWTEKPPPIYLSSFKRWQNGFLEAYLRQRLTDDSGAASPLIRQIENVRREFPEKPFVAFEVVLRLLNPELPKLRIELDHAALETLLSVAYGETGIVSIPYRTRGAGMPFAAIRLEGQYDALQLESHEIVHRQGRINLRLHSNRDVPVRRELQATLSLKGQTTQLTGDKATLRYCITYPVSMTLKRVLIGGAVGAGIMGVTRLLLMPIVPQTLWHRDVHFLSRATVWPIILVVLGVAFYGAFRFWVHSLVKHAR